MAVRTTNMGGEKQSGWNDRGEKVGITIQAADVTKVLGSVSRMTEAKNTIMFSNGRSIIVSDPDGRVAEAAIRAARPELTTELTKKNGVYSFDMYVPAAKYNYEDAKVPTINATSFAWLEDELV